MSRNNNAKVTGGIAAAVLAAATAFVMPWEGKENTAYLDRIASPAVWTVCYGHTGRYAYEGATYSDAQCRAILNEDVGAHYDRLAQCIDTMIVPVSVQASFLELGFNVGTGAACSSTMARKINAGDYEGACAELGRWVNAGGVVVRGLVNRRNASEEMCVGDL